MFDNCGYRIFALIDCQIILCSGFLRVTIVVIFYSACSLRGDGLCTTRILKDVASEIILKTVSCLSTYFFFNAANTTKTANPLRFMASLQMILLCISTIVVCVDSAREAGFGVSIHSKIFRYLSHVSRFGTLLRDKTS